MEPTVVTLRLMSRVAKAGRIEVNNMKMIILLLLISFAVYAAQSSSDRTIITHAARNEKIDHLEMKRVPVHRYLAILEASIKKDTQWVVYEQNDEALWARVQQSVTDMLMNEWRAGKLMGTAARQAFFVTCNRTTITRADIDNGRLICQIGVAPVKPAEFAVFQLEQPTASTPAQ